MLCKRSIPFSWRKRDTVVISIILMIVILGCAIKQASMSPEETLLRSKCTSCHLLPEPAKFSKEKWRDILDAHKDRVRLDKNEREMLEGLK